MATRILAGADFWSTRVERTVTQRGRDTKVYNGTTVLSLLFLVSSYVKFSGTTYVCVLNLKADSISYVCALKLLTFDLHAFVGVGSHSDVVDSGFCLFC